MIGGAGGCIPVGACGLWPQRGIWHPSGLMALGAKGCVAVAQGAKAVAGGFAERLGSEIGIEDRGALLGNSHPERSSG